MKVDAIDLRSWQYVSIKHRGGQKKTTPAGEAPEWRRSEQRRNFVCDRVPEPDVGFRREVNAVDPIGGNAITGGEKLDLHEIGKRLVEAGEFLRLLEAAAEHAFEPWVGHRRERRRGDNKHLRRGIGRADARRRSAPGRLACP